MKKILFILLLLPLFAYPQAEKRHRSIIVDSLKALNGGIVDAKDTVNFEKPLKADTLKFTDSQTGLKTLAELVAGDGVGDSSFVTLQWDTAKAFNNTNLQFTDSAIFQEHLQTDKSFTVNKGLSLLKGIDATSGNFGLKVQDNVATELFNVRNDGLIIVGGRIDQTGLGNSTFLGFEAGLNDDLTTNINVAIGHQAFKSNITGTQNVAIGHQALLANTGDFNTAIGHKALFSNIGGEQNTAIGLQALEDNTTGSTNTAIGSGALANNIGASSNTAIGKQALSLNTSGFNNTAIGDEALKTNTAGGSNVAIGKSALEFNTTSFNTAVGASALLISTGTKNIAFGQLAGDNITTGERNIIIGQDVDGPSTTANEQLVIGNLIFGTGLNGTGTTISTGNIGIAITNPSARFHVRGTDTTSSNFAFLAEDSAGTDLFSVRNDGNVEVAGDVFISGGNNFWITDASGADSARIFDDGDTTRFESDNPIKIGTNSLIVATDGTVSIGTEANFTNNAAAVTFGAVGTDADVVLTFDAVTAQGSITYMEDEDRFDFDNDVNIAGDLTVTGTISGGIYGTQGFADSSITIAMTQNNYFAITNSGSNLYINGVANGDLVFTGDSVQVTTVGDYSILWDLSYSGANTDEYHIAIFVNNVEQAGKGEGIRDMTSSDIGLSAGHTILTIPATHWISLRIKNINNNNDATIIAGNLVVKKQ